ncbi:hypothetical protein ACWC5I_47015 [Kitasatospora sp. NPDC001574]
MDPSNGQVARPRAWAAVVKLTLSFWYAPPVAGVQVEVPPSTPR